MGVVGIAADRAVWCELGYKNEPWTALRDGELVDMRIGEQTLEALDGAMLQRLDRALGTPHVLGNLEVRQAAKELEREDLLVLRRQVAKRFTER